jgi:uncharacterized membrane protein
MSTTTLSATGHSASEAFVHRSADRLQSIDIIRGAVMILMALDHVRVYAGVPAGGPTAALFFTRWITNFCAPAFVFFAGTGAYLLGRRLSSPQELSRFLLTRAALLIVLELTYDRLVWTFNLDFMGYNQLNVIWAIAWSMVVLALLVRAPLGITLAFGLTIIGGHNLVDVLSPNARELLGSGKLPLPPLLQILYFGGGFRLGEHGPAVIVLYSLIPWIGVMACGYVFGSVMKMPDHRRREICVRIGVAAVAGFLLLRAFNWYGNPHPWRAPGSTMPKYLSFLSTTKYPASLQFLLMTLGPCILLLPLLEHAHGRLATWLTTFGRVPLFFYLLHIPFIHLVAIAVAAVRTPGSIGWLFTNHPVDPAPVPAGYQYSLLLLWIVWLAVVVLLYFPTKRYAALKAGSRSHLLSYL